MTKADLIGVTNISSSSRRAITLSSTDASRETAALSHGSLRILSGSRTAGLPNTGGLQDEATEPESKSGLPAKSRSL
jgi:hypothetical protein